MLIIPYLKRIMSWPCHAEDGCGNNLWQMVREHWVVVEAPASTMILRAPCPRKHLIPFWRDGCNRFQLKVLISFQSQGNYNLDFKKGGRFVLYKPSPLHILMIWSVKKSSLWTPQHEDFFSLHISGKYRDI